MMSDMILPTPTPNAVPDTTRVLVTGANGFLGRHVVSVLREGGADVIAMARSATALTDERFEGTTHLVSDLAGLAGDEKSGLLVAGDSAAGSGEADGNATSPTATSPTATTPTATSPTATSPTATSPTATTPRSIGRVDAIVHCAALSTPWGTWEEFKHANVDGTAHVLEFARRNGVRRVVFVSSPSVYSAKEDRLNIKESDPLPARPLNHYIASKIAAENLLQAAYARGDLPELVILRPRGLIGVGDTSLIPRLLKVNSWIGIPLFHRGENLIDLTSVENVAAAAALAVTSGNANGQVYNITNGDPREFAQLLALLMSQTGLKPRNWRARAEVLYPIAHALEWLYSRLPGNPEPPVTAYTISTIAHSQTLDISRAREELGYVPRTTIEQSISAFSQDFLSRQTGGRS